MLKCEKSFFRDETHYWAVLVRQGNAKENYSCLKPLLSLSSAKGEHSHLLAFSNKKVPKKWFDRAALWRVYVYLISSTSMQKENPFWNSVRQIKIRCAKYKFAERSHNFLMQLPMQLIFGVSWDLDKLQICAKGKSILEFHSVCKGNPRNSKNPKN